MGGDTFVLLASLFKLFNQYRPQRHSVVPDMSNTRTYKLFRPEALLAGELAWQGRPALALGLPAAFTSISAAAVVMAAVVLITLGGYTRRVDMEGTVVPRTGGV